MAKTIEYYRMWDDHTWDTDFIEIEAEEGADLDQLVRSACSIIKWKDEVPVLVGCYCSMDEEEEEEPV